jgi:hypothetical protein
MFALFAAMSSSAGVAQGAPLIARFEAFKVEYGRSYASAAEEATRFDAFSGFVERVDMRNADPGNTAEHGITKFADRTVQEMSMKCGGPRELIKKRLAHAMHSLVDSDSAGHSCPACARFPELTDAIATGAAPPEAFDWTEKGAVTPVKNQGRCGDCFAFSCVGDVEGTWFLAGHNLTSLSEQQVTSCDHLTDLGCQGSSSEIYTMEYVKRAGGLASEATYPFLSGATGISPPCNRDKEGEIAAGPFGGSIQISGGAVSPFKKPVSEPAMMKALVTHGPMTVAVNAMHMESYRKGVDNPAVCPNGLSDLDHEVLIVGYGEDSGTKYWKIKNSWKADWGEQGYYRLVRGSNKCGVADDCVTSIIGNSTGTQA